MIEELLRRVIRLEGQLADLVAQDRSRFAAALFSQTADVTVANTVTETTLVGSGAGTVTVPANYLAVGRTIRITASGVITDTGNPNINIRCDLGGTTVVSTGNVTVNSVTDAEWHMEVAITCITTGVTGSAQGGGIWEHDDGTSAGMVNTSPTTVDTTGTLDVDVTAQWDTADASNTITCQQLTIEILR